MYDICCVGHITLDKIVTPQSEVHMAGGTSFYFSNAIQHMPLRYILVTSVASAELKYVNDLRQKGINVHVFPSPHSTYFENNYTGNQDHRTQRVWQEAAPFTAAQLAQVQARYFHLGPLLAGDIPVSLIATLAAYAQVSLDVQGYLRHVQHNEVLAIDWQAKKEALQHISILKANESETAILTGTTDVREGARILAAWGVAEVVLTFGSQGSLIYANDTYYDIPAYPPATVTDATGCGDTYMAGYLYQRAKGAGYQQAGHFAAAMASLKIETSGPFTGTETDVLHLLHRHPSSPDLFGKQ